MKDQFILIDYENVHSAGLLPLYPLQFNVILFLGASQTRLPTDLVLKLQRLGDSVRFVQASRAGKNALDFHITFYLGRLAATHPDASFYIISKDTGFDALIQHVQTLGVSCKRLAALSELRHPKELPQSALDSIHKVAAEPKTPPARPDVFMLNGRVQTNGGPSQRLDSSIKPPSHKVTATRPASDVAQEVILDLAKSPPTKPDNVLTLNGHVQTNGVSSQKPDSLCKSASPKMTATRLASEAAQKVIAALAKWGSAKPQNAKTLRSAVANLLKVQPGEPFVDRVLRELEQRGALRIAVPKVTYSATK